MSGDSIELKIRVQSPADEMWNALYKATQLFPVAIHFCYRSISIRKGDGMNPGSVRFIEYGEDSPYYRVSEERIEEASAGQKKISCSVIGGDFMAFFKSFRYDIVVTQEGSDVTLVKWRCEYELLKTTAKPRFNMDILVKTILRLDDYLRRMRPV